MPRKTNKQKLIDLLAAQGITVLEDNIYTFRRYYDGMLAWEAFPEKQHTLMSYDTITDCLRHGIVIRRYDSETWADANR